MGKESDDKKGKGETAAAPKRQHRATYSTDKRKGGYMIRVEGPMSERFAGREVPVTMKSGEEHMEKLVKLVWTGQDQESGKQVSLYTFAPKPQGTDQVEF